MRISTVRYKWLPFKLLLTFICILLFLAVSGPVEYEFNNFYLFVMVMFIFAFFFFTWIGMAKASTYSPRKIADKENKIHLIRIIKALLIIEFPIKIALVVSSIQLMGLPSIGNFFSMLANVYADMHGTESFSNVYRQVDTFTTMMFYFSTFSFAYWRKAFKKRYWAIAILNIGLDLFYQLCFIGTQRSIITLGVLILTLILYSAVKRNYKIDKRKLFKAAGIILVLMLVFMNILGARRAMWYEGSSYIYENKAYNFDNWFLFWCVSDGLKYNICQLISYLTQGFYGLSLAFQVPFQWTFFLGSVRGLNSIISQIFPFIPSMVNLTYPVRAGEVFGFDGLASWYTIFPWLASDFTFLGALVYMGLVGWLYMRCWIQVSFLLQITSCLFSEEKR